MVKSVKDGITIEVKVKPQARQDAILERNGNYFYIALKAPAQEGKANEALIRFLSKYFKIPKSKITLIKGEHARLKVLRVEGVNESDLA